MIITLKDTIQHCYSLLTVNCLPHLCSSGQDVIMCYTLSAYHMQYSCARWYEGIAQLLSLNCIYFSFILLAKTINWWRRGGNRNTRRKPLTMRFRKCQILKPENQAPTGTQTCTLALMESRRANHYTACCPFWTAWLSLPLLDYSKNFVVTEISTWVFLCGARGFSCISFVMFVSFFSWQNFFGLLH